MFCIYNKKILHKFIIITKFIIIYYYDSQRNKTCISFYMLELNLNQYHIIMCLLFIYIILFTVEKNAKIFNFNGGFW